MLFRKKSPELLKKYQSLPVGSRIQSDIPFRLDRLPWSPWHWRIIITLGVTWILDGLEVTIVSAVAAVLLEPSTLNLNEVEIGVAGSLYLLGAILGSLFFGRLTDRVGRKKLFLVTIGIYIVGTLATALSWDFPSFICFRMLTGAGIGGEGSAISSIIDELLPAKVRGRVGIALNGTYWLGAALGAALSLILLNERYLPHSIGWRLCFGLGGVLALGVFVARKNLPESPRWLILHGRVEEAEKIIEEIEMKVERVEKEKGRRLSSVEGTREMVVKGKVDYKTILNTILHQYRSRAILGLSLIVTQAFAYNAIFFTYALILVRFYGVKSSQIGYFLFPFAVGNWLGPTVLGRFFDTIGRRKMICGTYGVSGLLLACTGYLFAQRSLSAISQTALWCLVFFFASSGASAAYLTVSEIFPVEMRGLAIALFYSIGTITGGLFAPALFSVLIQSGSRQNLFYGYLLGACLMICGAIASFIFGVSAEGKSLEALSEFGDIKRD